MKNDRTDELIALAFGDLRGEAAELAEARIASDPAAMNELNVLREVKATLRAMPVPEHQLSTERLSHAILSQGLEPKRSRDMIWIQKLWGPVAVASVFLAFMLLYQTPFGTKEPAIVMNDQEKLMTGFGSVDDPLRIQLHSDGVSAPTAQVFPDENIAMGNAGSRAPSLNPSPVAPDHFSSTRESTDTERGFKPPQPLIAMKSTDTFDHQPVSSVAAAAIMSGAGGPSTVESSGVVEPTNGVETPVVIVINRDRDLETGAQSAVEVSRGGDIVIGG